MATVLPGLGKRGFNQGFLFWLWLRRDIKSRYAGSIGGLLWALLQPLVTILIFYVLFARVLQVRVPELASATPFTDVRGKRRHHLRRASRIPPPAND